jgi:hypothetical protein
MKRVVRYSRERCPFCYGHGTLPMAWTHRRRRKRTTRLGILGWVRVDTRLLKRAAKRS